jgi:Domain of unknown function (DUF4410)
MRVAEDQPSGALELQAAQDTRPALAEGIVERLQKYGFPAELLTGGGDLGEGTMLVQGQFVGINQGNRTRRVLIGLWAGKSSVSADKQIYYATDRSAPPRFMMSSRARQIAAICRELWKRWVLGRRLTVLALCGPNWRHARRRGNAPVDRHGRG